VKTRRKLPQRPGKQLKTRRMQAKQPGERVKSRFAVRAGNSMAPQQA
jgi:hypothetical protein